MGGIAISIGWAVIFMLVGAIVGIGLVLVGSRVLPRILERLTPDIDEEREIARGNVAAAEYFGRVVAAGIIGLSIVVAAAIVAGIIAAALPGGS